MHTLTCRLVTLLQEQARPSFLKSKFCAPCSGVRRLLKWPDAASAGGSKSFFGLLSQKRSALLFFNGHPLGVLILIRSKLVSAFEEEHARLAGLDAVEAKCGSGRYSARVVSVIKGVAHVAGK